MTFSDPAESGQEFRNDLQLCFHYSVQGHLADSEIKPHSGSMDYEHLVVVNKGMKAIPRLVVGLHFLHPEFLNPISDHSRTIR